MDIGYISALSALAGSMLGGLASGFFTYLSQRAAAKAGSRAHDKARRQDLYREFVIAASKTYADAAMRNEPDVSEMVEIYAMVSRMRMLSSPAVLASAEQVMRLTSDTFLTPNMSYQQLHDVIRSGALDPLKAFAELAREELLALPPV